MRSAHTSTRTLSCGRLQAKYKEMNIKVSPAKPDYVAAMKAQQAAEAAVAERSEAEERANRELQREIHDLETRIARKRVRSDAAALTLL